MIRYAEIVVCLIIGLTLCTTSYAQSETSATEQVAVLYQQAVEYHNAGNYAKAIEYYTKVIERDAAHADAYWNRGNIYGSQERYDLAVADLRKVIVFFPDWGDGYGNLGWYLLLQGKFEEAREACQKASQLAPENFALTINLGHTYLLTGDPATARTYYKKALPLITSENAFKTGPVADFGLFIEKEWQMEACRLELTWMKQEYAKLYREANASGVQANELFGQGRYLEAAQLFVKTAEIEEAGITPRLFFLADQLTSAGYAYEQGGQYDKSLAYYEQAVKMNRELDREDRLILLLTSIGRVYHVLTRYKKAITAYEQALELTRKLGQEANMIFLLNSLGMAYHSEGRYEKAIAAYKQVLDRIDPEEESNLAILLSNMGMVYQDRGDYEKAIAAYQQALELSRKLGLESTMTTLLSNMGLLYDAWGEYDKALTHYKQSLELARKLGENYGIMTSFNNIGAVYDAWGDYDKALDYYEQALELARKFGDESIIAIYLNNIGGIYNKRGDYNNAFTYYEQASELIRRSGDETKMLTSFNNLGAVYDAWGDYDKALVYYEKALGLARKSGGKSGIVLGLNNIGGVYHKRGDLDKALDYYNKALGLARELKEESRIGTLLNNIGRVYDMRGDYDKALNYYEQALKLFKKLNEESGIAGTLNNIGGVYRAWAQYEKAIEYFMQAVEFDRKSGREADIIRDLNNIALVYSLWGQYDKALTHYEQALELARKLGEKSKVATVLNNIGSVYEAWRHYDKALDYYNQALELARELGEAAGIALYLNNIGGMYNARGDSDKAFDHFQQALEMFHKLEDESSVATCLNNIGGIYHTRDQYDEAITHYKQALEIDRKLGRKSEVGTRLNNIGTVYHLWKQYDQALAYFEQVLELSRNLGEEANVALSYSNIGAMYYEQKKYPEAIVHLEKSIEIIEKLRKTASGDVRREYLANQIENYQALTSCYIRINDFAHAFQIIELSRAKLLAEQLAGFDGAVRIPSLNHIQNKLPEDTAVLIYANTGKEKLDTVQLLFTKDTITASEHSLNDFMQKIMQQTPDYADAQTTQAASRGLNMGNKKQQEVVATDERKELDFKTIIERYRVGLQNPSAASRGLKMVREQGKTGAIRESLNRHLYNFLLADVGEQLEGKTKLVIVPDGLLNFIPFESLIDDQGQYLAENYTISYAQSLVVLELIIQRQYSPDRKPLLAFGGAVYDAPAYQAEMVENEKQLAYLRKQVDAALAQGESLRGAYAQLNRSGWSNLPGTLSEVKTIQTVVKDADIVTGKDVNEVAVKALSASGDLADYKVLHFATHGTADFQIPELSALVLSLVKPIPDPSQADSGLTGNKAPSPLVGEGWGKGEDGYLRAGEIANLNLKADFVSLSACETGLGKLYGGEGVVGLTQAFLLAGANGLSVSLWQVADDSTAQFMVALYTLVEEEGLSYAEAVTEVKRRFIAGDFGEQWKAPYYWAPFVYYGR